MENDSPEPFSLLKNFRFRVKGDPELEENDPHDTLYVKLSRNLKKSPRLAKLYGESFAAADPGTRLAEISLEKGYVKLITDTRCEYDFFRILVGEGMDLFSSRRAKGEHLKK